MIDIEAYLEWMRERGYADSTRAQSAIDVQRILRDCAEGVPPPERLKHEARRFRAWGLEMGVELEQLEPQLSELADVERPFRGRLSGAKRKKYPRAAMAVPEWQKLGQLLRSSEEPEGRVLRLALVTGLRIGDVLRIERRALARSLETGKVELRVKGGKPRILPLRGEALEAAAAIIDSWGRDGSAVHEYVYPEPSVDTRLYFAAYQRCRRKLLELSREAGITSRMHSHRLRRTMARQAYQSSHDIELVRQLLSHESAKTTLGYIHDDETSAEAVDLQEAVGRKLQGIDE